MSAKFTSAKPFIIMMYSFPGAGKTAFSSQLSEELNLVHLQEDKIRHDLFGRSISQVGDTDVKRVMNYMATDFLKVGVSVVYDASVIRGNDRKKVRDLAKDAKADALLVWLQVDPETTFVRTQKRDRRKSSDKFATEYDKSSYQQVLTQMQNPIEREEYIVISGKHTFKTQLATVMKKLYDLGLITPEAASSNMVKPELMSLVPKNIIRRSGEIAKRNITIR